MGLGSYALTEAGNTRLMPEQQMPGTVNDGTRQIQADLAVDYRDREWTEYGKGTGSGDGTPDYSCSFLGADTIAVGGGNLTTAYHPGRAIRITGTATGTVYATVLSASYDGDADQTEVILQDATGDVADETSLRVWLSTIPADGLAFPMAAVNGRPIDMGREALTQPQLADYSETRPSLTITAGAVTWDRSGGNTAYLQLTENVTSLTITGWPPSPQAGTSTLIVQQDATGARTMTGYPAAVAWLGGGTEPDITPDAWGADILLFMTMDGGTHIIGNAAQAALFAAAIG